eukprot:TRINITY_DN11548_c0_g1_i1.p1 TRINITY_DN11548_c0_g1~~TRINITY_DN11548_c0_g1_i1.p1  ORF type:complete len:426 (-),score=70.48 TRINITY_DN11548_c0_g1_i1:42-1319(-)
MNKTSKTIKIRGGMRAKRKVQQIGKENHINRGFRAAGKDVRKGLKLADSNCGNTKQNSKKTTKFGTKRRRGLEAENNPVRKAKRTKTSKTKKQQQQQQQKPKPVLGSSLFTTNLVSIPMMKQENSGLSLMQQINFEDELESSPAEPLEQESIPNGVIAIDEFDKDDPQQCIEFVEDILDYLRFKEKLADERPNPNYMDDQNTITESMRGILVDWMFSVCIRFSFLSETLFLATSLLDRFLSRRFTVGKTKLQLVGIGCLLIASKFEEILTPCIADFIYISGNEYTRSQILKIEGTILSQLEWNISYPNPLHFLRRFSKAARSDLYDHTLSKYIAEASMCSYQILNFKPSVIAASAVYLSRRMMEHEPFWDETLVHYTKTTEEELLECARALNEVISSTGRATRAVQAKYSQERFHRVAATPTVIF